VRKIEREKKRKTERVHPEQSSAEVCTNEKEIKKKKKKEETERVHPEQSPAEVCTNVHRKTVCMRIKGRRISQNRSNQRGPKGPLLQQFGIDIYNTTNIRLLLLLILSHRMYNSIHAGDQYINYYCITTKLLPPLLDRLSLVLILLLLLLTYQKEKEKKNERGE
jgi:hypothetical protein